MIRNHSRNQRPDQRLSPWVIVGLFICIAGNLLLSVGLRAMDRVELDLTQPAIGPDFWQNLPDDVREKGQQIAQQSMLIRHTMDSLYRELSVLDDGTEASRMRIDELVDTALVEPIRAFQELQKARTPRIEELKAEYLARKTKN
jgi:hypothetical protein